jgi:hypothetical protein
MKNSRLIRNISLAVGLWSAVTALPVQAQPEGATVIDADAIFYIWPYPTISPDGNSIAYVSKGRVLVSSLRDPAPRKVLEVPNSYTWPKFTVQIEGIATTGSFNDFYRLSREQRQELHAQVTRTIYGIIWAADSKNFSFGVEDRSTEGKSARYDGYLANVDGTLKTISQIEADSPTRGTIVGVFTRDRKHLVSADIHGKPGIEDPLIWDVAANKPRATCFDYLTPSPTSDRWIGIEKDSRQLVIADANFDVVKRFDEVRPDKSFGLQLNWAPNERFIIWRNQIGFDHFSNWEGFRMDLDTGAKRPLIGRFMDEKFQLTGDNGEFYRCGQTGAKTRGYDMVVGAHLTIVPNGDAAEVDLWRLKLDPNDPRPGAMTNRPGNPPVHMSSDGQLFAIGLPRKAGETSGFHWHLIDRAGKIWRFPTDDNGEYVSPYDVAGFGANGQVIVGYDTKTLFTVPLSTIQTAANLLSQ